MDVTTETAKNLGLTPDEFEKIKEILGRTPNFTELSIYSVMWSEHCSYKNSILQLKTLPRGEKRLLVAAGEENAGLVDQSATTSAAYSRSRATTTPPPSNPTRAPPRVWVVFTAIFLPWAQGPSPPSTACASACPVAPHEAPDRGRREGIGDYGNCFGVPTVGGEVYFMPCYNHDILVNAMSAGIVKAGETVSATAGGRVTRFYRRLRYRQRRHSRRYICQRRPLGGQP